MKGIKGDMQRQIDRMIDRRVKEGKPPLRGRQLAKIVYDKIEPEAASLVAQATENLDALVISKASEVEHFITSLDAIVDSCPDDLPDTLLEAKVLKQLKKLDEFSWDLRDYERSSVDKNRNYQYLRDCIDGYLERERRKKVANDLNAAYKAGKVPDPPASALLGGGADKGAGRGRQTEKAGRDAPRLRSPPPIPSSQKPCWSMRDHGKCDKGDACEFSHDKDVIAKSKKDKEAAKAKGGAGKD